jgi:hypothetical protein
MPQFSSTKVVGERIEPFGKTTWTEGVRDVDKACVAPPSPHFYGQLTYAPVNTRTVLLLVTVRDETGRTPDRLTTVSAASRGWLTIGGKCVGRVRAADGLLWFTLPRPGWTVDNVVADYEYDLK